MTPRKVRENTPLTINDAVHNGIAVTAQPLRVGIVGAGAWARQAHLPGFQACPDVEVVAICDVDLKRAELVARDAGVPEVFPSAEAMLASVPLHLVSVVTPDDCHRADVAAALAAGAHVLCEKPLAVTLGDARALAASAAAAGVMTKVGFAMRYAPAMMRLRELIHDGQIGTPWLFQAFQQNGQFLDPQTAFHWKMDKARTSGGAIVEYGIHTLDLARWIMGEAASVCATGRTWVPKRPLPDGSGMAQVEVDDSTAWLIEFRGGAIGTCHAGWATVGRPPGLEVRVFGSHGAVRCLLSDDLPEDEGLWLAGVDGHFAPADVPLSLIEQLPQHGAWWFRWPAHLIRAFVAEIATHTTAGPTFDDGAAAQEILAALLISMRERRWVDLPLPPLNG
jgi:predicted dehydrogenase